MQCSTACIGARTDSAEVITFLHVHTYTVLIYIIFYLEFLAIFLLCSLFLLQHLSALLEYYSATHCLIILLTVLLECSTL